MEASLIFDIDGVLRDVSNSYRRALADTVEHFTARDYRPTALDIDQLKAEGLWNNDWEASLELISRFTITRSLPLKISLAQVIEFFQQRYRGTNWNGYIQDEPLIANCQYFQDLTKAGISWGFFSGATRGSAGFVLERLNIVDPVLVAMEDAPGKPDPTGLFLVLQQLEQASSFSRKVIYVGDTVADMLTIGQARASNPNYQFWAVGVIPPHVEDSISYGNLLRLKGADLVLDRVLALTPEKIAQLLR